jgi:phage terminase small subunit
MPPLLNAQHEIFAQEVAKGRQIGEAYALAGFNPHPANPTRLGKKRDVAERIKEIKEKATERVAEQLVISKKRVLEELAKIAFANMADFMTVGASGEPVLNWRNLTHDQAAALQEVTVDEYIEGRGDNARQVRRVKFKLAPKQPALEKIGIELGMFVNRSDNKHSFEKRFSQMPPEERRAYADTLMDRAQEILERHKTIEAEAHEVTDGED